MLAQVDEDEWGELPDRFLRADLAQPATGKAAADGEGEGDQFVGDDGRRRGQQSDERAGVRTGKKPGKEGAFERQVGGVVLQDDAARDAGHERHADRQRKHQAIDPAAPLEDQNATEPVESREHRGEHRNGRQPDEQRQQELLGREDARFHRGHCTDSGWLWVPRRPVVRALGVGAGSWELSKL